MILTFTIVLNLQFTKNFYRNQFTKQLDELSIQSTRLDEEFPTDVVQ